MARPTVASKLTVASWALGDHGIGDTFRRMNNILLTFPADDWTPEEAQTVLAAMESIVRRRQAVAAPAR
jgi:hypothetical protein